jgi:phage-related protein
MDDLKHIIWVGSSKDDLNSLPEDVKDEVGFALYQAQKGGKSRDAEPLKGFGGASILEIIVIDTEGTFRSVYTIRFKGVIAVLHVFKKKSKKGIATPKQEIDLIKSRIKLAEIEYNKWLANEGKGL